MSTCYTGTNIPEREEEICKGCYTNSACVIHAPAIVYLNLPLNSPLSSIITNLVLALAAKDEVIAALDARITALEAL